MPQPGELVMIGFRAYIALEGSNDEKVIVKERSGKIAEYPVRELDPVNPEAAALWNEFHAALKAEAEAQEKLDALLEKNPELKPIIENVEITREARKAAVTKMREEAPLISKVVFINLDREVKTDFKTTDNNLRLIKHLARHHPEMLAVRQNDDLRRLLGDKTLKELAELNVQKYRLRAVSLPRNYQNLQKRLLP